MSSSLIKTKPGPVDVFTQAFALQYISLILFILIFSIAAFLKKDSFQKPGVATLASKVVAPKDDTDTNLIAKRTLPISSLALSNLSSTEAYSAIIQTLSAYSHITRNHDLDMRFKFYIGSESNLEDAIALARLLVELSGKAGISSDATHVRFEFSQADREPEITLERRNENR